MIHGFYGHRNKHFPKLVKDAYLDTTPCAKNYIVVDWSRLSRPGHTDLIEPLVYPVVYPAIVVRNVPTVSKGISEFLQFLVDSGQTEWSQVHIVGHSLGAHISGYVGDIVQDNNDGEKVGRITGLDPAGPFFDPTNRYPVMQRNLRKTDAAWVDVYHTSMGMKGDSMVDGHVDFYPNGGRAQPGCPQDEPLAPVNPFDPFSKGSCSHEFVVDIYAATIRKNIESCKCDPNKLSGNELEKCAQQCPEPILAGDKCHKTAQGLYYFVTEKNP
ncbi:endothelial lipase isoform X2 [Folsomia candida]|nr:endothelial lipase isoform X2 [Folsomia candida]